MKSDAQRIAAYTAKYYPDTVALKVAAALATMKSTFSTQVQDLVAKEVSVQEILNAATISTLKYPYYYNYAREIWKLINSGIDGDSLEAMVQSLHDKYEAYGLATATLILIASTVFNVTVT